jgi:5-methylcytosine-specific restriction endonuclease McrA
VIGWLKGVRARLRRRWVRWRLAARNRATASTCFYCGTPFTPAGARQRTVDHRVPRALGGTEGLANLVFACRSCNQRKGDLPEDEFVASEWLARRRLDVGRERRG